ncbi:hypothetical protein ACFCV3_07750 [Kribbella sp. NPDC056345]|uniref:RipA family octameric membrane protein n=1 Tax=Kribbella sp. NPDC056345 TaxID=3345789 RepID=UPI0035DA89B6
MTTPGVPDPMTVDLYKLAVEMADRISARRATANSFFLTVQTAFVGVVGLAAPSLVKSPWWANGVVAVAGVALSVSWWLQLRSYRDLNRAKFNVILELEKQLPHQVFADEWKSLKADPIRGLRGRYAELGAVERFVPWVFAALYILLFIGKVV